MLLVLRQESSHLVRSISVSRVRLRSNSSAGRQQALLAIRVPNQHRTCLLAVRNRVSESAKFKRRLSARGSDPVPCRLA